MKQTAMCRRVKERIMDYLRTGDPPKLSGKQEAHTRGCILCGRRYSAAQMAWHSWEHPREVAADERDKTMIALATLLFRIVGFVKTMHSGRSPDVVRRMDHYLVHEAVRGFHEVDTGGYLSQIPSLLTKIVESRYPRPLPQPPPPPRPKK